MAKKKATTAKYVVLKSGHRYKIVEETGRYYICENNVTFRKSLLNEHLGYVDEVKEEVKTEAEPEESEE